MGNCQSNAEDKAAIERSKEIDNELRSELKSSGPLIKLLLLGSGDSGKSTVLKQFRLVYGTGFTDQDRALFKPIIIENTLNAAKALISAMETLEIPFGFDATPLLEMASGEDDPEAAQDQHQGQHNTTTTTNGENTGQENETQSMGARPISTVADIPPPETDTPVDGFGEQKRAAVQILSDTPKLFGESDAIPDNLVGALLEFWKDPGVQYCFLRSNEFQLIDSCSYFMQETERIFAKNFKPTDLDILTARVITTSVIEQRFVIEGVTFKIFDVGGQRSERKKWAPYFDDVVAIIFISAISCYDQIDLFKVKLKNMPISQFFPDYNGPNTFKPTSEFFARKFVALNKNQKKKIYVHFTWATDTEQIKTVLKAVKSIIIKINLESAGI
ncbi:Guanine nucleotide-binding protein G(o) subunit alpha [Blyttiomyces sp. JEL0837]|nr:Guanine nucleotide-binding protein G(o) subunit alpha [Blyttiomyces sp. JEL0837]